MTAEFDWDPSEYDPREAGNSVTAKRGTNEWQTMNNQLALEWDRFNQRLAEHSNSCEDVGKPLTAAQRSRHVTDFRQLLTSVYGGSAVDPEWEEERRKRIGARDMVQETRGSYGSYQK